MSSENLRAQILESQRERSDLMRWKLLIVAALGAAGLGIQKGDVLSHSALLLALMPLVCVYVDALCAHLSLRIFTIGEFIHSRRVTPDTDTMDRDYEMFLRRLGPKFRFETLALHWSSLFVSIVTIAAGHFISTPTQVEMVLTSSGILGVALTCSIWLCHRSRRRAIAQEGREYKKAQEA